MMTLAPSAAVAPVCFLPLPGPCIPAAPLASANKLDRRTLLLPAMLPVLAAASLQHGLAPMQGMSAAFAPNAAGFPARTGRAHTPTALGARGGPRGGNMGRGRGPQYGQTPRKQEPSTLSLDEFMALSSRLDDDTDERPGGEPRGGRAGARLGPRGARGAPLEVKPGDWTCAECGINVFASKTECFRCRAPRPRGEAAGPGAPRARKSEDYSRAEGGRDVREERKRDLLATSRGLPRSRGRGGRGRGGRTHDAAVDENVERGSPQALWKSRIAVRLPLCLLGALGALGALASLPGANEAGSCAHAVAKGGRGYPCPCATSSKASALPVLPIPSLPAHCDPSRALSLTPCFVGCACAQKKKEEQRKKNMDAATIAELDGGFFMKRVNAAKGAQRGGR